MAGVDPFNTGFMPYTAVPAAPEPHWQITGHDSQVLTVLLEGNEKISTEPGTMMYMSNTIETEVDCDPINGCGRWFAGENCVKVNLTNQASESAYVGLTPNFPAKVVGLELSELGGRMYSKSGAIMSSIGNVNITSSLDCNPVTCCCAGLGCVRQVLEGDGSAFLAAGGTLLQKNLADGETMKVDTNSLVAFQDTVTLGVSPSGNLCGMCCGGEGIFNTTVTGPGIIVIQSMSFQKWYNNVKPPQQDGGDGGGVWNASKRSCANA